MNRQYVGSAKPCMLHDRYRKPWRSVRWNNKAEELQMSSNKAKERVSAHLRAKRSREEAGKLREGNNNYGVNSRDKSKRGPSPSSIGTVAMNHNLSLDRKGCSFSGAVRSISNDTALGKVNIGANSTFQSKLGSIPRKRPSSYKAGREREANASRKLKNEVNLKLNRVRRGTIEDMQRGLIEWDIMAELQAEVTNCRRVYETDHESDFRNIAVPCHFQSFEDYLAVWTPLAIRELRAHFMNKCLTEPTDVAIPVRVSVSHRSNATSNSLITLDVDIIDHPSAGNILAGNEILIMMKHGKALTILQELEQKFYAQQVAGAEARPHGQENPFVLDPRLSGMLGICTTWSKGVEGIRVVVHRERFSAMKLDAVSNLFWLPLGPQVQFVREWLALNNLDSIPLATEILNGGVPTTTGCELQDVKIKAGCPPPLQVQHHHSLSLQDNGGESDAMLLNVRGVVGPQIRANIGKFHIGINFMSWLERKLNPSQKFAVEWAATHEGFTLIKGPPGTGKTTTLTALLNAIHVREYNRYYEGILNLVTLPPGSNLDAALRQIRDEKKPHILVAAPSNIAVDNIINRILDNGFLDGTGKTYKPDILRVGRSFGPRVACVSLEERVNSVVRITESQHRERKRGLLSKMDSLRTDVSRYMTTLQLMLHADRATGPLPRDDWEIRVDLSYNRPYFVNHKMKTTQFDPPELAEDCEVVETKGGAGKEPNVWSVFDMPEYIVAADGLINALEEYHCLEYEKKTIDFALQHGNTKNVNDHIFRDCLEGVFLGSAHIVFSTLNSSGQECMANCTQFKVVVIDEAAQSMELSTLIPLRLGGRQCVLVGDPQQLSATVFSQNGAATQYDRSLFERLEDCGHRVHLLDTQYRMHPAISYFPRMQFYDNKLLDGPNVLQQSYSMPYHTHLAFQPFVFMNLKTGATVSADKSLSNPAEAQLAVNVYLTLSFLTKGDISGNVGIITPYNSQRIELGRQFKDALGNWYRDMVEISTVDGFQGREKNAIIVSLVRAHGKGVGFLKDLHRMNVALTRAQHYLCVIGHEATLSANSEWEKLIDRSKKMGSFIDIQDPSGDLLQLQVKNE